MDGYNSDNNTNILPKKSGEEKFITLTLLQHILYKKQPLHKKFTDYEIKLQINQTDKYWGWTPLMVAVLCGKSVPAIANVKLLLTLEPNIDAKNSDGMTALMLACKYSKSEIIKKLVNANASVNIVNKEQESTALTYILERPKDTPLVTIDKSISVRCLLEAGADVNYKNSFGLTPLMSAVVVSVEIVNLLLEFNANPNVKDIVGTTPLMRAVRSLHVEGYNKSSMEIISALLKSKIDIHAVDNEGNTALQHACKTPIHQDIAEELIKILLKSMSNYTDENLKIYLNKSKESLAKWKAAKQEDIEKERLRKQKEQQKEFEKKFFEEAARKEKERQKEQNNKWAKDSAEAKKWFEDARSNQANTNKKEEPSRNQEAKKNFEGWDKFFKYQEEQRNKWGDGAEERRQKEKEQRKKWTDEANREWAEGADERRRKEEEQARKWKEEARKKETGENTKSTWNGGDNKSSYNPPPKTFTKTTNTKTAREILGVTSTASTEIIKKAYHLLALKYHPDKCTILDRNQATEKFKEISNAYQSLV